MYKLVFIFLIFFSLQIQAQQTAEDSIKQTINTFFTGMQNKDTASIRTLLTPSIFMQTVATNKKGETVLISEKIEGWFNQIVTLPPSIKKLEEKITFDNILVDNGMAMAWTPFTLYINDTIYSCGVNMFQLVKLNNQWKVNYIIDTRRKNCEVAISNKKQKRKNKKQKNA
jgi:hypothetical protein